jgi:hypothetical protein
MKFKQMMGASVLAASMTGGAAAAGPGVPGLIDRPTPPACCADGICYPNVATWGAYPTRWRRWPSEALAPTPAEEAARRGLELRPYEPLRPEEEDRRAPLPTPAPEREEAESEEGITRPPATPTTPPSTYPPSTTPGTPTFTPPGNLESPTQIPFEDDQTTPPTTEPGNLLPFGQLDPPGDDSPGDDPPPAPPFRARAIAEAPVRQRAELPKVSPSPSPVRRAVVPSQPGNSDDPPPAFPLTLG